MARDTQRIVCDPKIRGGAPILRGTRIAVADVLEWLAAGDTVEEIVSVYPQLTREDVLTACGYAADELTRLNDPCP